MTKSGASGAPAAAPSSANAALRAAKVPVEAHFFQEGAHGFGLRFAVGKPVAAWPDLVLAWLKRGGLLD